MLSECSNQLNQASNKKNSHSPYFLQYKIFEQRLKQPPRPKFQNRHGLNFRTNVVRNRKDNEDLHREDYLALVKQMLNKNENVKLFGDFSVWEGLGTQPVQGTKIQIKGFISNLKNRKSEIRTHSQLPKQKIRIDSDELSQDTQNSSMKGPSRIRSWGSRVKSEANTAQIIFKKGITEPQKDNVSFIRYKRNRKLVQRVA